MSRFSESVTKSKWRRLGIRLGFGGAVLAAAMLVGLLACVPKESHAQTQTTQSEHKPGKGRIEFFEGNRGTQDPLTKKKMDDSPGQLFNLKHRNRPIPNDEARSMVLSNVAPGVVIRVYDSPSGATNDDYAFITVLESVEKIVIDSFENKQGFVRGIRQNGKLVAVLDGVYVNGLDGKVSRIEVAYEPDSVERLKSSIGTLAQGLKVKSKLKKR
jgi:hypothetical protein